MKIYVIGDSISVHYGPYLEKSLKGMIEYSRKEGVGLALKDLNAAQGANGGDSLRVLTFLKEKASSGGIAADLLVLNCGLHDIKTSPATGAKQVPLDEYETNLEAIIVTTTAMKLPMIWVRTTPCDEKIHNRLSPNFHRFAADGIAYNEVADRVMKKHGIPMIDLYAFTLNCSREPYIDHVHFTEDIRQLQGAFIAGWLCSFAACGLNGKPACS